MAKTRCFPLSLIALSLSLAFAAQAQAQNSLAGQREAIDRLTASTGASPALSYSSATGAANFVRLAPNVESARGRTAKSMARAVVTDASRDSTSRQFLSSYGGLFGISNAQTELGAARVDKDQQGRTHITYPQVYHGLPVFGAELKAHFDGSDTLAVVNGTFVPGITVAATPTRSADSAIQTAKSRVLADLGRSVELSATKPTLMIYREGLAQDIQGPSHLVWQVEVGNGSNVREFVYVDAHSGKVVDKITGIHENLNRRAFDAVGQAHPGPNYPNTPFWVEGNAFPTGTTEADNMIQASAEIYNLMKNAFGRDAFNGQGATMDSIFDRGSTTSDPCPNASWNGTYISFCPGTTTDDVTAHEWGHAYTQYTDALIYAYQPGALNEAYSDIWGETVDRINGRGGDTPDALRTANACTAFTNATQIVVTAPAAIAGLKSAGTAAFGPQTFSIPSTSVVVVNDGSGTANDGCETPFVNAAAVAGKLAFMDRGTCSFAIKAKNAQLNGAIGVIIGNNAAGAINMSGDDATITIPSLSMLQADGTALKAQAAGSVTASLQRGPGTDNSVRWLIGEDSSAFGGAIRDMYNPTCYGNAGKVSDTQYTCTNVGDANSDQGGVHSNSGIPNHGYALLVDGGTYNGQTVTGIGLTKAAHIYWRAQSVYQNPASGFAAHADAVEQSCQDLVGVSLNALTTAAASAGVSGEVITAADCAQVAKMTAAVELRTPNHCSYTTVLQQNPPALCAAGNATAIASDSFDGGKKGGLKWAVTHVGSQPEFTARDWGVVNNLPSGRAGYAIAAADPNIGTCQVGGDESGLMRLESPEITIPADATAPRLTFDHWVATETGYDGGNLKISVNGGAWTLVKAVDFIFNPYNRTLASAATNTSPLAGQPAFSGTDAGSVTAAGSWGRSIVNLAPYATANDKVKLRFEMGSDGCGGQVGWYLDDVMVYRCTP